MPQIAKTLTGNNSVMSKNDAISQFADNMEIMNINETSQMGRRSVTQQNKSQF